MISSTTFSIAPVSVTCFMPRASTIARGSPPSLQTISNRSLAILPEIDALADQVEDRAELRGGDRRVRNLLAFLVQPAGQLVDHPVGRSLGVAPLGDRLEEVRGRALGHQHAGVIGREPVSLHEPRLLLVRQLRQLRLQRIDLGLRQLERQAGPDRGNSDSRAPPPWSASSASRACPDRRAASPGRSCRPPR